MNLPISLRSSLLAFGAAMASLALPVHAAKLPTALVEAVRPVFEASDVAAESLADWDDDHVASLDLSPDGIADWELDFNALGYPAWCGTGGCRHQVWVSHGGTYVLALDEYVVEIVSRAGQPHTIDVELHGGFCREPGNAPCSRSFAWNAARKALDEVANADGATLLTGPLFQPVATDEAAWPEIVQRVHDAAAERCVESGAGSLEWGWPASSIPDIDGDGARDWVLDDSWLFCETDGEPGAAPGLAQLHVFASNHGQWQEKLTVPDAQWAIDISSRPASLVVRPLEY